MRISLHTNPSFDMVPRVFENILSSGSKRNVNVQMIIFESSVSKVWTFGHNPTLWRRSALRSPQGSELSQLVAANYRKLQMEIANGLRQMEAVFKSKASAAGSKMKVGRSCSSALVIPGGAARRSAKLWRARSRLYRSQIL